MARSCTNWYLLQSRSFESNLRCHCIVRGRFNTLKLLFVQNLSNKWTDFEGYHQRLWAEPKRNKRVGWNGSLLGSKYFGNQAISSIYWKVVMMLVIGIHQVVLATLYTYMWVTRRVKSNCDQVCYTVAVTYRTTAVDQMLGLNLRGIDLSFEANATKRKLIWARYNINLYNVKVLCDTFNSKVQQCLGKFAWTPNCS